LIIYITPLSPVPTYSEFADIPGSLDVGIPVPQSLESMNPPVPTSFSNGGRKKGVSVVF